MSEYTMSIRPKLGIALGGGSARGWAHIGVLRALAQEGVAPDYVAGCSMGAMVGAAFAAGRIEKLESWALSLDWKRIVKLLDIGLRGGLIKGERLVDFFHGQFVECQFSELAIPFATVATELASGREIWLREGKVADAVRASCTVPGLFEPVLHQGRYLIDGSVVNPVPVSLCRSMGAEVVIAVSLSSEVCGRFMREQQGSAAPPDYHHRLVNMLLPRHRDQPGTNKDSDTVAQPAMLETVLGAIDIMQAHIARSRLAGEPPDVLLTPHLGQMGSYEYHRAAPAIDEGRDAVARVLPTIRHVAGL
jgi:NTE family protein